MSNTFSPGDVVIYAIGSMMREGVVCNPPAVYRRNRTMVWAYWRDKGGVWPSHPGTMPIHKVRAHLDPDPVRADWTAWVLTHG